MKNKPLIISATAALCGMALMQLHFRRLENEISGGPRTAVLIAAGDIAAGSTIEREMLGVRELPRAYMEERHIRAKEADRVMGARVNAAVKANESLLWTDIAAYQGDRGTLSGLVQEGMRAITVKARATGLAGLILPGDRVDVLFTRSAGLNGVGGQFTSTLLQNLLVLAVGTSIGAEDEKRRRYRSGAGVTLSATVDQAQLLTQAEHQGELKLVLRNPDDIVLFRQLPRTTPADVAAGDGRGSRPRSRAKREGKRGIEHVR
jgi:pilus assembly protein CpaB